MTQEDKELLIKDLCARLPYGVVIHFDEKTNEDDERLYGMRENGGKFLINDAFYIEEVKPYLFPLSSMTEEQINDCPINETNLNIIKSNIGYGIIEMPWRLSYLFVDWCNKNHFDYRGLIPKGLAIDATDKNIY